MTLMADTFTKAERSRIMAAVRSHDTTPELVVRRLLHRLGYRFRLHVKELPGTPDILLPKHRTVVEVRGCFWHGHTCGRCRVPATRREYWLAKIARNQQRDRRTVAALRRAGWRVLVLWECQLREGSEVANRIRGFLQRRSAAR
jgi:DNA mismatch endonuclease, patch repair protein